MSEKELEELEEHDHHHHDHDEHDHEHDHHDHHDHDHEEGCCCEHDHDHDHHDHDHEDGCCCEHDHDHDHDHHDHDHEDGCGCGCDHDHDEHGHHHDHGHKYEVEGYKLLETHVHEGATVCSFEKETKMPTSEAKAALTECFNEIEAWLNGQGAIIGHVKGYIREAGPTTAFSTVGGGLNVTEHAGLGATIGFASIVFGPDEETMKDKVVEIFAKVK